MMHPNQPVNGHSFNGNDGDAEDLELYSMLSGQDRAEIFSRPSGDFLVGCLMILVIVGIFAIGTAFLKMVATGHP